MLSPWIIFLYKSVYCCRTLYHKQFPYHCFTKYSSTAHALLAVEDSSFHIAYNLLTHSPLVSHEGHFQTFIIINNILVSTLMHKYLCAFVIIS